jgi:hypothetical protein
MLIETGVFCNDVVPGGLLSEVFVARVVIPETEFSMLGIDHQYLLIPGVGRVCRKASAKPLT